MEGYSEYEENNTKPSKQEIMRDVSELETEYRMLHTKHTIDEINKMYKRDKIKSKNSKFFFWSCNIFLFDDFLDTDVIKGIFYCRYYMPIFTVFSLNWEG